ncbi:MAG: hypothetical protein NVSMB52_01840 [Chloroflexota bacterium]
MKRFKTSALIATLCSTLVASASAFAAGTSTTPTASTAPTPAVQTMAITPATASEIRVTCGVLTELHRDWATIQTSDNHFVHVKLSDATRYLPNSQAAAIAGLKEGDFAATRVGDEGEGAALTLRYGLHNFCRKADVVVVNGRVSDFTPHSLTVKANNGDPYIFELTGHTHYFVNGHSVAKKPKFEEGEQVRVKAIEEGDGSYTALDVSLHTS